jgi:hypothetical protein
MGKTGLLLLETAPSPNHVLEHYESSTLQPIVHKWVGKYPTEFCGNRGTLREEYRKGCQTNIFHRILRVGASALIRQRPKPFTQPSNQLFYLHAR